MRTIEYYDYDYDKWFDVNWCDVVSGTMIRVYEEDGTPIPDGTGIFEMKVMTDAYQRTVISGNGLVWHIDIADPDPPWPVPLREE